MTILEQQGLAAKQAARKLAIAGTAKKNEALEAIARALEVGAPQWLAANAEDMKEAEANGMRPAMLDRLRLTEQRVADIVAAVRQVIALPDPVGRVTKMETAAKRLADWAEDRTAGRDRNHLRGAAQCDGRCGGALPQIRQCLHSARRQRVHPVEPLRGGADARRAGIRGTAGGLHQSRAGHEPRERERADAPERVC